MKVADGVYFRREDYAPFWLRVLVDVLDLLTFGALYTALTIPVLILVPLSSRMTLNLMLLMLVSIAFFYFVIVRRSSFRTLGYRVGRVRIVALDGQAPSYSALTLRLMFGMLSPLNWLLDVLWLSSDTNCQALRDKLANTYVVKLNAQAAGSGRIVLRDYHILYYNCLFREVEVRPEPESKPSNSTQRPKVQNSAKRLCAPRAAFNSTLQPFTTPNLPADYGPCPTDQATEAMERGPDKIRGPA